MKSQSIFYMTRIFLNPLPHTFFPRNQRVHQNQRVVQLANPSDNSSPERTPYAQMRRLQVAKNVVPTYVETPLGLKRSQDPNKVK